MNRKKAEDAFKRYTDGYDASDRRIRLKIEHTYRVADIAQRIAASLDLDSAGIDFAWFLGLLHDIGRFEQVRCYGTFNDKDSIDHAEYGADILFRDGLLADFIDEEDVIRTAETAQEPADAWKKTAETAVRLHNKLSLPEGQEQQTAVFCRILRDADKADIFRVLAELPYAQKQDLTDQQGMQKARPEIMQCVMEHRCVPRKFERTKFETLISHCCMAFELVYPESRKIVREQGYLHKLVNRKTADPEMDEQLAVLRLEIADAWNEPL